MSTILAALALAAAQTPPAAPADLGPAAQHQDGPKQDAKGCCCKGKMAEGHKMECCKDEAGAETGGSSDHSSH